MRAIFEEAWFPISANMPRSGGLRLRQWSFYAPFMLMTPALRTWVNKVTVLPSLWYSGRTHVFTCLMSDCVEQAVGQKVSVGFADHFFYLLDFLTTIQMVKPAVFLQHFVWAWVNLDTFPKRMIFPVSPDADISLSGDKRSRHVTPERVLMRASIRWSVYDAMSGHFLITLFPVIHASLIKFILVSWIGHFAAIPRKCHKATVLIRVGIWFDSVGTSSEWR